MLKSPLTANTAMLIYFSTSAMSLLYECINTVIAGMVYDVVYITNVWYLFQNYLSHGDELMCVYLFYFLFSILLAQHLLQSTYRK